MLNTFFSQPSGFQFMQLPIRVSTEKKSEVRQRKGKIHPSENSTTDKKQVTFHMEETAKFRTDFCKDGSFQKVVKFSWDHSILATGGADGFLRIWKVGILSFNISLNQLVFDHDYMSNSIKYN